MKDVLFEDIKEIIINVVEYYGMELRIEDKTDFFGVKLNSIDKYFLCFISYYRDRLTLTYREDITKYEVRRIEINVEVLVEIEVLLKDTIGNNLALYHNIGTNVEEVSFIGPMEGIEKKKQLAILSEHEFQTIDINVLPLEYQNELLSNIPHDASNRLMNCLHRGGIFSVKEFLQLNEDELTNIRYMGKTTLNEAMKLRIELVDQKLIEKYFEYVSTEKRNTGITTPMKVEVKNILPLINVDHYKFEYSEEEYERYLEFNNSIEEIFELALIQFDQNEYIARNAEIYQKRIGLISVEKNTLQAISEGYGISRERVRQVYVKMNRRMKRFKSDFIIKINELPEEDMMNYFFDGIGSSHNVFYIRSICEIIGIRDLADAIVDCNEDIQQRYDKIANVNSVENRIFKNMVFPADLREVTTSDFSLFKQERMVEEHDVSESGTYELKNSSGIVEYESLLERRIISVFDNAFYVSGIKTQSIEIPYEINGVQHIYYPDILLHLTGNHLSIVEVKTVYEMATTVNLAKYDAMKEYCERNGYGYLMTDARYNTIESLEALDVPHIVEEDFLLLLRKNRIIKYGKIKEFCIYHGLTMNLKYIISLLIKYRNEVTYSTRPFCIKSKISI